MPGYPEVVTPLDANNQPYVLSPNSRLRIVGIPGDSLRVYLNATLIFERLNWSLNTASFVAFIASQSGEVPNACSKTTWDNFELSQPLGITSSDLTPNVGPAVGGTEVTIHGFGLGSVSGVSFAGTAASVISQSAAEIKLVVPQTPSCRTEPKADVCFATASGSCCLADAWTWLPALSLAASWQPSSSVLMTLQGHPGSTFLLFAGATTLPCPGVAAPPSPQNFLLGSPIQFIAPLPNPTGTILFGGLLPANWPSGISVTLQAAETPSNGKEFVLTNAAQ